MRFGEASTSPVDRSLTFTFVLARASMDIPESKVHSFVVKLWLEETGDEPAKVDWHGYITHVPGGERNYLKKVSDVGDFIAHYLEGRGVEPEAQGRVRRCLRRFNLRLTKRF